MPHIPEGHQHQREGRTGLGPRLCAQRCALCLQAGEWEQALSFLKEVQVLVMGALKQSIPKKPLTATLKLQPPKKDKTL